MQPIPRPGILDPEHPVSVVASGNADVVASRERDVDAFGRTSQPVQEAISYTNQMWDELQHVREYLHALAGENDKPSPLHDGHDWESWAQIYAEVTSALAGPRGDSGHGASEARQIAQKHGSSVSATAGRSSG